MNSAAHISGFRVINYLPILSGVIAGWISIFGNGIWTFALPIYAFFLVPSLELIIPPNPENLNESELDKIKDNPWFDYLLYLVVPVQYSLVLGFLWRISSSDLSALELSGLIFSMGIGCAILGINVAHELGHRANKFEQFLSKSLLLTSLYMHFFIEHNRGHHKNVSTEKDPASSRHGEILYLFWVRSVIFSFISAWKIENKRLRKQGQPLLSFKNEMIQYMLIQIAFLAVIYVFFGAKAMGAFILAAVIGFLLLETVNYIEHYGLSRKEIKPGIYEAVAPHHSWNSNHLIGRIMLFELSRHSDHHYRASRKYQILRHMEGAPQMPTGYPGMMILSLFPPLWFAVMNKRVKKYNTT